MNETQAMGCLVGLAVGDALGFPTEFRSRAQILSVLGGEVTDFLGIQDPRWGNRPYIAGRAHPPGTYSDDTQMTLAVARGLIQGHDLEERMRLIARNFVAWSASKDNDRAPGNTCLRGCANLAKGVPWHQAGVPTSKGCGSAMRVAPIGIVLAHDIPSLLETARASSLLTHGHDAAVEGAAAAALMVAMAAQKASPPHIYEALMEECAPRSPDLARCLSRLPGLLDAPVEIALSRRGLGEAWVAEEAVASALWCFWQHPDDFEAGVLLGVTTDGDSDSIACITGSILGARLGLEAIPERWRNDVEDAHMLHALGLAMWNTSQQLQRKKTQRPLS